MIKKLIITALLLCCADYAFNGGEYVRACTTKLKVWAAESSDSINNSIFRG